MTTTWTAQFAHEVMNSSSLRGIVDFEQSYVGGDIGEGPVNESNWMNCFHGESECRGHTVMLCAKNVSRATDPLDYRWFDMIACMDGPKGIAGVTYGLPTSIPNNAQKCATQVGLDWGAVSSCANGTQGAQLLHDSHYRTMALFAAHGGYDPAGHGYRPPLIPNIWVYDAEGKPTEYNDPLIHDRNPYADLVERVCAAYSGPRPAACDAAPVER